MTITSTMDPITGWTSLPRKLSMLLYEHRQMLWRESGFPPSFISQKDLLNFMSKLVIVETIWLFLEALVLEEMLCVVFYVWKIPRSATLSSIYFVWIIFLLFGENECKGFLLTIPV